MNLSDRIAPFMRLRESGELEVTSNVSEDLINQLCRMTNSVTIYEAYLKIRRVSRTRIKMRSTYYPEVFSVPKFIIKEWTRSLSLVSVPGLYSDLDLEKGKYEGGFKVWESTHDLIDFITQDKTLISQLLYSTGSKFKVLELGAGASLPSLALLSRLIGDPLFTSQYRIHIQDYNWEVLASLTLINFAINLPSDYFRALIDTKCLRFYSGDWKNFRSQSNYKYDLIMMSEVIYNFDNYDSLHNLMDRHLKSNGYVVIATKNTYFGLSGGLYSWLDYSEAKAVFSTYKLIKVSTNNIPRSILIMKKLTK